MDFGGNINSCELQDLARTIPYFGKSFIVCCDPGTDDIVMQTQVNALGKNILGFIPCAGNTTLKNTMSNVLLLNEITEKRNLKVFPGSDCPSQATKQIETATHVFGPQGLCNLKLPSPIIVGEEQNGVDFAVNAIKHAEIPITIISTGGMTDLHKILQRIPAESINKIAVISIMGGVLDLKQANAPLSALKAGKDRWAEFNVIYDPTASQSVFKVAQKLNIPVLLSTLDLTHTITFKNQQIKSLRKVNNYVAKIMSDLMGDVPAPYLKRFGKDIPQQPAHDLNASMCVFHPNLYTYERGYLAVDGEESAQTRGKTTFNPDVQGNVYVLKIPQERRAAFFKNYENDLKSYDSPTNIIKGYLYDIKSDLDIQDNVVRINRIIEKSNITGELNLAGLLITREILTTLIEIVKMQPKLQDIRMSLSNDLPNDITKMVNTITLQCEKNRSRYWSEFSGTFVMKVPFEEFTSLVKDPHASILEIGCGYGRNLNELSKKGYNNLHGVDLAEGMILRAKEEFPDLKATLTTMKTTNVPYTDKSFDAIFLVSVLTCIPDSKKQENLIMEIKRLLKPGGVLIMCDFLLSENPYRVEQYKKYQSEFTNYGTFISRRDGQETICRHHTRDHLKRLLSDFKIVNEIADDNFKSMNETQACAIRLVSTYLGENPTNALIF
jgi:inosine-uridine nucleoside N-ribohydrolase/ubiquinone/menaquinone biosynthesis C-methylase UbiE